MTDIKDFVQGHRLYVNTTPLQRDSTGPIIHKDELEPVASLEDAVLVSSELDVEDWHSLVLDLDYAAHLEPSTTPGHFHLYLNKVMTWGKYKTLLKALAEAGVIEWGYYEASIERGATMVRAPGVLKGDDTPVSKQVVKKALPS